MLAVLREAASVYTGWDFFLLAGSFRPTGREEPAKEIIM